VRLLLDTHSFLWFIEGDKRLPQNARQLIADMGNDAWISVASLWEIAIKASLGKLSLLQPFAELIPDQLRRNNIRPLPIELHDLAQVAQLPFHHRDPFDRLIIAQAMIRDLVIIGKDPEFTSYPIRLVWETIPANLTIANDVD
jgi:PIN domain nuclease of toxin-antitoxin system